MDEKWSAGLGGASPHGLKRDYYAGAMHETTSIDAFMEEARKLLADGATDERLGQIGRRLAEVGRDPGFVAASDMRQMHGSDSSFHVLRSDPDGLTLVLGRFSAKAETPVHDHNCWGVACVIKGRDHYRHWQIGDGGRVRILYERELEPGSFVTWLDPPRDIHSQQGIGDPALELILFGKNAMTMPRRYYNPETGEVRTALPQ
jgi:predicted metal-dependent enzyme (double-stranded beta helix superfamily)